MRSCSICRKKPSANRSFFRVPPDERKRTRWNRICPFYFTPNMYVCEEHFRPTDFMNPEKDYPRRRRLMPGAVPFINNDAVPFIDMTEERIATEFEPEQITCDPLPPVINIKTEDDIAHVPTNSSHSIQTNFSNTMGVALMQPYSLATIKIEEVAQVPTTVSSSTQTVNEVFLYGAVIENMDLRKDIKKLNAEIDKLKLQLEMKNSLCDSLRQFLTGNQIRKLAYPGRKVKWTSEDISNACSLRSLSPKAYKFLYKKGYPVPSKFTLRRWAKKARTAEQDPSGSSKNVLQDLNNESTDTASDVEPESELELEKECNCI